MYIFLTCGVTIAGWIVLFCAICGIAIPGGGMIAGTIPGVVETTVGNVTMGWVMPGITTEDAAGSVGDFVKLGNPNAAALLATASIA